MPPRTDVASTETRPTSLDKGERGRNESVAICRPIIVTNRPRATLSRGQNTGGRNAVGRDSAIYRPAIFLFLPEGGRHCTESCLL